jgi:Sec-independent protein secretion pathway component TatC
VEEKNQAVKYATVAAVLIAVGVLFGFMGWLPWLISGIVAVAGMLVVAFIWGYVGALEAERSGER